MAESAEVKSSLVSEALPKRENVGSRQRRKRKRRNAERRRGRGEAEEAEAAAEKRRKKRKKGFYGMKRDAQIQLACP